MNEDEIFGQTYADGESDYTPDDANEEAYETAGYAYAEGDTEDFEAQNAEGAETQPEAAVDAQEGPQEGNANAYVPLSAPQFDAELFTAEEAEQLNDMFLNGQGAQATAFMLRRQQEHFQQQMQHALAANSFSSGLMARAQSELPELFRVHGPAIQQTMHALPPQARSKPSATLLALVAPAMAEADQTGDVVGALKRFAQMATGQMQRREPAPQPQKPQPLPPSQRTGPVTPGSSGRATGRTHPQGVVKDVMELFGAEEGDVKRALNAAKGRV